MDEPDSDDWPDWLNDDRTVSMTRAPGLVAKVADAYEGEFTREAEFYSQVLRDMSKLQDNNLCPETVLGRLSNAIDDDGVLLVRCADDD